MRGKGIYRGERKGERMVICCFDGEGLFLVINVVMLHEVGPFGGARWGDPLKGISKRAVKRTQG